MKSASDPRHLKRKKIVKDLFARSFREFVAGDRVARKVLGNQKTIDDLIRFAAPEWPIEKINKVDLAILRLAVYELKIARTEPPKVIIDEAVELAKEFGSQSSSAFINGTLGTLLKNEQPTNQN